MSVINLRQIKKQRERDLKAKTGSQNAARHGQSKAQKQASKRTDEKARAHLDQHRLDD